jgi:ppGpp synthetase/RelA/SpoT-type nucleotidyltranferase
MLTQNDLKQIKVVVEEVFDRKFDEKFDKKFDENFDKKFDEKIKPINKEIKGINKRLDKIQKDLSTTINYFDHNFINHEHRLQKIENNLKLSSPS